MKKIFIINGHQYYDYSKGKATETFINLAKEYFATKGYKIKYTVSQEAYDAEKEVEKHVWADVVFLQTPINWMGVTWSFKKYMDEVYTAGMFGKMCNRDGRSAEKPKENYGMGGVLTDTKYMLSITSNAPAEAFNDPSQAFFEGMSLDDLFKPMHLNFKFMGMKALQTFAAHDLMKNPEMDKDIERFKAHLKKYF